MLVRKFHLPVGDVRENRACLLVIGRHLLPTRAIDAVREDADDSRILECAVEHVSDFILSGYRDLLRLHEFEGIPILRVSEFLERAFGVRAVAGKT